jgi:8-oxo-dGTP pyrophosphatase MutT (NUDIX family)
LSPVEPRPSATVVLLREVAGELEVLMVRRNEGIDFHGGAWVFPGGRLETEDRDRAGSENLLEAARYAAVREAQEEAGLSLEPQSLHPFAEWITPDHLPKRYRTWFFVGRVAGANVRVDGGEVVDHRWVAARRALAAHREGTFELPVPTFVTLTHLASHASATPAISALTARGVVPFHPRMRSTADGPCSLFQGDVSYEGAELDAVGARHRLTMFGPEWRYERNF